MRQWLLLVLLLSVGCRDDDAESDVAFAGAPADSVVWGEDRARPGERAGAADRLFLEGVLDHYQGIEYLAERMRRTSTVSAVRRDAWRFDQRVSGEREEVDATLRRLYGERYLPTVPEEFHAAVATILSLPREQQARALLEFVSQHQREDVAQIDSILPALEHPEVQRLARELRRDQRRELRVFARRLARD